LHRSKEVEGDIKRVESMSKEKQEEWLEGEIYGNPESVKMGEQDE